MSDTQAPNGTTTAKPEPRARIACWCTASQIPILQSLTADWPIEITAAGGDSSSAHGGTSTAIAQALNAEPIQDLRRTLPALNVDALLVYSLDRPETATIFDDARQAGSVRILCTEPVGQHTKGSTPGNEVSFLPRFLHSPAYAAAAEELAGTSRPAMGMIETRCGPETGSLGARIVDAMDTVFTVFGEPERVDASIVPPRTGTGVRALPGSTFRGLRGMCGFHLRYDDGGAVTGLLSDRPAGWYRSLRVIGDQAHTVIEEGAAPKAAGTDKHSADSLARAVLQQLDPHATQVRPNVPAEAIAMAHAALLSARTRQPESPETLRRMGTQLGV